MEHVELNVPLSLKTCPTLSRMAPLKAHQCKTAHIMQSYSDECCVTVYACNHTVMNTVYSDECCPTQTNMKIYVNFCCHLGNNFAAVFQTRYL